MLSLMNIILIVHDKYIEMSKNNGRYIPHVLMLYIRFPGIHLRWLNNRRKSTVLCWSWWW